MKKPQMAVSVDKATMIRLDALAKALSEKCLGIPVDRSKVVRLCIDRSIRTLEAEAGL